MENDLGADMALTVKGVDAKKEPGMYGDGGGLYLRVGPTGAKSWILRTVILGKRRELGIGGADLVTLAEARDKAAALRKEARDGGDPDATRKTVQRAAIAAQSRDLMTFAKAADHVHKKLLPSWRNKKHGEVWLAGIELHANPTIGKKSIHSLGRDDVLKVLELIWIEKPETAKRLRQRMATVFDWAIAEGHYPHANPVQGLKFALPKVATSDAHYAALHWRELPAFTKKLADRDGTSARCLEFIILTAARSGEARGALWAEIDLEGKSWNIPGDRMKRGKPHRVPLSPEALAVLEGMRGMDPVFCFPSPRRAKDGSGQALSDMTFKLLFKRMVVEGFTTHGFRSTFRDWCSESAKADPEIAEAALSHATGNAVTRAYARSDLIDRRRELMDAWARFATGQAGQVVQLVRA